jgi:hypothetical protein
MLSAFIMSGFVYNTAKAQIGLGVSINLGRPAYVEEAPVYNDDDYDYIPDIDAYYSVMRNCYYYQDGGRWITAAYLPGVYRDYDWRSSRYYEVHDRRPYMHANDYRTRYSGYNGQRNWAYRDGGRDNRAYAGRERVNQEQWRGRSGEDRGYQQQATRGYDNHAYQGQERNNGHGEQQRAEGNNGWAGRGGQQQQPQQRVENNNGWAGRGGQQRGEDHNNGGRGNNDNRGSGRGGWGR